MIKETLRLVAPVPMLMRKTVKDAEVEGHHIPAGTLVAVAAAVNHFDPACWTQPDAFDPHRFGPERQEDKSHRNAWIPFGGGVHKCIGLHFGTLEVKAILHEMLLSSSLDGARRLPGPLGQHLTTSSGRRPAGPTTSPDRGRAGLRRSTPRSLRGPRATR